MVEPGDVGQVVRGEPGGRAPVGQQRAVPGSTSGASAAADAAPARAGRGRGGRDGTARDPAGRASVG